eukprot:ANDGO_06896.mRNA.1 Autophagy-related protein 18
MSTNTAILPSDNYLGLSFNQDKSCLACATARGIEIFTCNPFQKAFETSDGGRCIVEMLYQTSLLATVGSGSHPSLSPFKLQLYNSADHAQICELSFTSPVLGARVTQKRLVVILRTKIHIFDISTMKILRTVDIDDNPLGLCAVSYGEDSCVLAFPRSCASGDVIIFDALHLHPVSVVKAHKSSIGFLQFNEFGTMLATCSEKGTLIRVFSIPNGEMLHSFRRGSYPTKIYSVSFNSNSDLLAVSSATGTVHIYKLSPEKRVRATDAQLAAQEDAQPPAKGLGSAIQGAVSGLWDAFDSERDLAHFKVPFQQFHVVAIGPDDTKVYVVGKEGVVVVHGLDPVKGGECPCLQEYDLTQL